MLHNLRVTLLHIAYYSYNKYVWDLITGFLNNIFPSWPTINFSTNTIILIVSELGTLFIRILDFRGICMQLCFGNFTFCRTAWAYSNRYNNSIQIQIDLHRFTGRKLDWNTFRMFKGERVKLLTLHNRMEIMMFTHHGLITGLPTFRYKLPGLLVTLHN